MTDDKWRKYDYIIASKLQDLDLYFYCKCEYLISENLIYDIHVETEYVLSGIQIGVYDEEAPIPT